MPLYICFDCKSECDIVLTEPIRCPHCRGRIMYKKRTDKVTQYIAR